MRAILAILPLLVCAWPAHALRCDGKIIDRDDHSIRVREHCGEPFWIDRYSEWLIQGEEGPLQRRIEIQIEVWFYNFGSDRLMHQLAFRDDRLQDLETLGYGFDRPAKGCRIDMLPNGLSSGEVVARCGMPQSRRERYSDQVERDERGNARVRALRREDWIYGEGTARDTRVVVMLDGRLAETQKLDR